MTVTETASTTLSAPVQLDPEQFQMGLYALGILGFLLALHTVRTWGDRS